MTTTYIELVPPRVPYPAVVREDETTDGGRVFLAEVPDLPGCMSHGDTPEEALQNLQEAIDLYLKALDEAGVPRPDLSKYPPPTTGTGVLMSPSVMRGHDDDVDSDLVAAPVVPPAWTS
jgi:antitoxin HicB